jgi:uncharacterized membrane protein YvbJ
MQGKRYIPQGGNIMNKKKVLIATIAITIILATVAIFSINAQTKQSALFIELWTLDDISNKQKIETLANIVNNGYHVNFTPVTSNGYTNHLLVVVQKK